MATVPYNTPLTGAQFDQRIATLFPNDASYSADTLLSYLDTADTVQVTAGTVFNIGPYAATVLAAGAPTYDLINVNGVKINREIILTGVTLSSPITDGDAKITGRIQTFALLNLASGLLVDQIVTVEEGSNGQPEDGYIVAGATYTADAALVRDLATSGYQWVSTRQTFASQTEFLGDPRTKTAGTLSYIPSLLTLLEAVASSGDSGWQNAGGQRHVVLSDADGLIGKTYYVDSVSGSDANNGLSSSTPFQTLGAAPLAHGVTIKIAAGSTFYEEFDSSAYSFVTLEGYGDFATNGIPQILGYDLVTGGWSDSTARGDSNTNVYSQTWTHTIDPGSDLAKPPGVFRDDKLQTWVTSLAACQSTPGSYYHATPGTSPVTIYYHPLGSTNPATDGHDHGIGKRMYVVRVGDNSTVQWVQARGAGSSLGSMLHGYYCTIRNIFMTGNPVHDLNGGPSLRERCVALHDVAISGQGWIALEYFIEDAKYGEMIERECVAIGPSTKTTEDSGFGGHIATGLPYKKVTRIDCAVYNCNMDARDAADVEYIRPNLYNANMLFDLLPNGESPKKTIVDMQSFTDTNVSRGYLTNATTPTTGVSLPTEITGARIYCSAPFVLFPNPADLELKNGAVVVTGTGKIMTMVSASVAQNAVMNYNIFKADAGQVLFDVRDWQLNGGSLDSDYNVFLAPFTVTGGNGTTNPIYRGPDGLGGVSSYYNLTDVQTNFSQEANSAVVAAGGPASASTMDMRLPIGADFAGVGPQGDEISYTPILKTEAEALHWLIYGTPT